jgi:small nuclear ribonucleoprotein D3
MTIAEDNMNVQLKDITVTARDGRVSHLDQVYIRGSHVRFFIVPDMLRYASSFLILLPSPILTQLHIENHEDY